MTERQQADESARVAATLRDVLETDQGSGDYINITDAVAEVAHALQLLGGVGVAARALEAHGAAMLQASENVAMGLSDIADALREITR